MERGNRSRAQSQSFQERGDPARSDLRPDSQELDLIQMIIRGREGASAMRLHVASDGALEGGRLPMGDAGGWLNPCVWRAELPLFLGRHLAASMRDSILRHASARGASRIHVSAMSETWLRMHETEYDKHRAEP